MTDSIPIEIQRTAWASLAAHLVILSLLAVVPLVKAPPMGASSMQVMLVSNATVLPPPVEPQPNSMPVEKVRAPMPQPAPVRRDAVALSKPVPLSEPRPAASLAKAPSPPVVTHTPPPSVATTRMSDEINKLLSRAPAVPPASPIPTMARTPQGVAAPQVVALGQCPPQAQAYCPLLERAINSVWNADTDPGVRLALESAGDATATMRMVILPDGAMTAIQISRSSGNDAYDRAVQGLLRDIRHLPPLPADMQGEPFVVLTTFTYSRTRK